MEGGESQASQDHRVLTLLAVQQEFEVFGDVLEQVEVFKYLGWQLSMMDDDTHAIRAQLVKAL